MNALAFQIQILRLVYQNQPRPEGNISNKVLYEQENILIIIHLPLNS